jgi:hypothetical protein
VAFISEGGAAELSAEVFYCRPLDPRRPGEGCVVGAKVIEAGVEAVKILRPDAGGAAADRALGRRQELRRTRGAPHGMAVVRKALITIDVSTSTSFVNPFVLP